MEGTGLGGNLLFIIIMIAVFFLLFIMPQRNMQKKRVAMLKAIKVGDEVETVARQLGKVYEVDGEYVVVDLGVNGERNRVRMHLEGIARTLTEPKKDEKDEKDGK